MRITTLLLPLAALAALAAPAHGQPVPAPARPLAENRYATVTRQDLDVELLRLPPEMRPGFWNQPRRVHELVDSVLLSKSLGAEARARGIDQDPEVAMRLQMEIDRFLGAALLVRVEEKAAADFDARAASFEARARELYRVERQKYQRPEQVSASHILFKVDRRSSDEARRLAAEARAKAAAGANFNEVAKASSEDASAAQNAGFLDYFAKEAMDPAFAEAAFALKNPGELSEPVLSRFGWHVIRLEGRRPAGTRSFEEVRGEIMAELKRRHVADEREAVLAAIRKDPSTRVDRAAIDALVVRTDFGAARRAAQDLAAPPAPPK